MRRRATAEVDRAARLRDVLVRLHATCSRRRSAQFGVDGRPVEVARAGRARAARTATNAASTSTTTRASIDDDVFFARFEDMTFKPVEDDPLSPRFRRSSRRGEGPAPQRSPPSPLAAALLPAVATAAPILLPSVRRRSRRGRRCSARPPRSPSPRPAGDDERRARSASASTRPASRSRSSSSSG